MLAKLPSRWFAISHRWGEFIFALLRVGASEIDVVTQRLVGRQFGFHSGRGWNWRFQRRFSEHFNCGLGLGLTFLAAWRLRAVGHVRFLFRQAHLTLLAMPLSPR
jgi:hypothetical protein